MVGMVVLWTVALFTNAVKIFPPGLRENGGAVQWQFFPPWYAFSARHCAAACYASGTALIPPGAAIFGALIALQLPRHHDDLLLRVSRLTGGCDARRF